MGNGKIVKKSWEHRRENLRRMCGNKCCLCGYDKCQKALEFHHIKAEDKSFGICDGQTRSIVKDIEEVKKCIMVCANCHREIHDGLHDNIDLFEKQYIDKEIEQELLNTAKSLVSIKKYCIDCGKEITKQSTRCISCSQKFIADRKKEQYPMTREELKNKIRFMSFVAIGKQYNCTDNNIRKYCVGYGLPKTKKEIKSYSDEEWENI